MNQKGEIELQKTQHIKAARSMIRLKHSLAADAEINERLPELEKEIDKAIHAQRPFVLDVGSILGDA